MADPPPSRCTSHTAVIAPSSSKVRYTTPSIRMRWNEAGSTDTPNPADTSPIMVMASPAAAQVLHMLSYTGAGTPDTVVDYLHRFAEHADADELMISPTATRQPDVLTAMELLADNWS